MAKIDDFANEDFAPPKYTPSVAQLEALNQGEIVDLIKSIKKVDKVKPKINGDPYIYKFFIGEKTLIIPSDKMLKCTKFSQRYLEEFNKLSPVGLTSATHWGLFIKALSETGTLFQVDDERLTTEVYEAENILNAIRRSKQTEDKEEFLKHPSYVLVDKDRAFICTEQWRKFLENQKIKTPPDRLLEIMHTYFVERKNKKCTGKTVYCYVFDSKIVKGESISLTSFEPQKQDAED